MGLINTIRNLGGAIGVAIWNSILNSKVNDNLVKNATKAALANGATPTQAVALIKALLTMKPENLIQAAAGNIALVQAVKNAYLNTYADAFK